MTSFSERWEMLHLWKHSIRLDGAEQPDLVEDIPAHYRVVGLNLFVCLFVFLLECFQFLSCEIPTKFGLLDKPSP